MTYRIRSSFALALIALVGLLSGPAARAESVGDLCDRLTAGPDDPDRRADAVPLAEIAVPAAIGACRAAVFKEPREPRWHYQLGRALLAAGRLGQARRSWGRAAIFDYPAALFDLGRQSMPGPGSLKTMHAFEAYSLLWRAANQGHAGAAEAVGRAHRYGTGVPESLEWAARWYAVAAAEGNVSAMRRLAAMYLNGTGVRRDLRKTVALLEMAAATGDPASIDALSWLRRQRVDGVSEADTPP
ncbi:MAG: tetratricopeptide repeat protein [Dongiaceae bacterium]